MRLVLPRPYPECLERYPEPFGVFDANWVMSPAGRPTKIRVVRTLDSKQNGTQEILYETIKKYNLLPFFAPCDFSVGKSFMFAFISEIFKQYPKYRGWGYIIIKSLKPPLQGWMYLRNFGTGEITLAEKIDFLPATIGWEFDLIFMDGTY